MNLYIIFFIVLIQLSLATFTFADSKGENWKLEISLEKDSYKLREPIWLDVVMANVSGDTLRSWGLSLPCQGVGFNIEITDSTGTPLPYTGPVYDYVLGEGFLVSPRERFYDSFDLLHLFGDDGDIFRFRMLPVGIYNVNASYGDAISNKIRFKIIGLSEVEKRDLQISMETSRIANQKVIETYSIARQQSADSAKSSLSTMIDALSNNPFAQNAAIGILNWSEFLERFPNSGHSRTSLEDYTRELSPEMKKKYLESVMIKYKGTRAARHAEQMLKMIGK